MYTGIMPFTSETKHLGWDVTTVSGGGVRQEWKNPWGSAKCPEAAAMPVLGGPAGVEGCQRDPSSGDGIPTQGVWAEEWDGSSRVLLDCWAPARGSFSKNMASGFAAKSFPLWLFPWEKRREEEDRDGRGCVPHVCTRAGRLGGAGKKSAVQVQDRKDSSSHPFYGYFACITLSWNKYQWMI